MRKPRRYTEAQQERTVVESYIRDGLSPRAAIRAKDRLYAEWEEKLKAKPADPLPDDGDR